MRPLSLILFLLLALAIAGCGDDNSKSDTDSKDSAPPATTENSSPPANEADDDTDDTDADTDPADADPETAAVKYYRALEAKDSATVCAMLTDVYRASATASLSQGKSTDCEEAVKLTPSGLFDGNKAKASAQMIDEDFAVVKVSFGGEPLLAIAMEREDGRWLVAGPAPLQ